MKNVMTILVLSISFMACDSDSDNETNFYNPEYRIGLWITEDKTDTLEFVDMSHVIRQGNCCSREEYSYRIEENILVIVAEYQGEEISTQHPIINADEKSVKLGNMYITYWTFDNSATFYKN